MLTNGQILIVGAVYDLNSGKVEFMENIATNVLRKKEVLSAI
jgi:carbonic anhydrase